MIAFSDNKVGKGLLYIFIPSRHVVDIKLRAGSGEVNWYVDITRLGGKEYVVPHISKQKAVDFIEMVMAEIKSEAGIMLSDILNEISDNSGDSVDGDRSVFEIADDDDEY